MKLSIVIPVYNERANIGPLIGEIRAAMSGAGPYEIVYVDDGSTDGTTEELKELREQTPELRVIRHRTRAGQSAAVRTGVRAASADWIATLDGDGQNDPADIPKLLEMRDGPNASPRLRMIAGWRADRKDPWLKRFSSRVANGVRGWLLDDRTPDTGCGLKLFSRAVFLDLPWFDHMHRFLPALFQRAGWEVISVPVAHRPRTRGVTSYGVHNRLWVGMIDLFGVAWLKRRKISAEAEEEI